MSPANSIQYFLGANSPTGFYSLYDQLLPPEQASAIYILKGGPGCGKSTLMRRVAALAQEAGEPVEYILCSGDPDSLDAILLPGKKAALVDGTAPHGTAPLGHPVKKSGFARGCGIDFWTAPAPGTVTWDTFMGQAFKNRRNCLKKLTRYGS